MGPISSIGGVSWPPSTPAVKAQTVSTGKASNVVSRESAGVSVNLASAGSEGAAQAVYAPSSLPPVDPASEAATALMPQNSSVPERSGQVPVDTSAQGTLSQAHAQNAAIRQGDNGQAESLAQTQSADSHRDSPSLADAAGQKAAALQAQQAQTSKQDAAPFKGELPPSYQTPTEVALDKQINELLPNLWKASRAAVDVLIGEDAKAAAAARAADLSDQATAASAKASDSALAQAQVYAEQQDSPQAANPVKHQGIDTSA